MNKVYLLICLASLGFLLPGKAFSQCPAAPAGGLNYGNQTPSGVGAGNAITVNASSFVGPFAGDYFTTTVVSGVQYEFTTCGLSSLDTYITVWDNATRTIVHATDDNGCGGTQAVVTWTATFSGDVLVQLHETNACATGFNRLVGFRVTQLTASAPPLTTAVDSTDVLCFGDATGSAIATPAGGTTPYTYLWSTGATTQSITGLTAGTYTVTVTDAGANNVVDSTNVNQPTALTANANSTDVTCNGFTNGTATVNITGGTPGYTFSWSNGGSTQTIIGLGAGTYTVTVTDANGCTMTSSTVVNQPTALTANADSTDITCNGFTNGTATVNITGGTPGYTFSWSSGGTTQTITGLGAGTYTVTVTDANSCTFVDSTVVNQPTVLTVNANGTDATCNGFTNGTATANVSGGTPGYTFLWSTGGTTQTITGLSAGTYTVTVTDANSCTFIDSTNVNQPTALSATADSTNVSCNGFTDGSATVNVSGGTAGYTFLWSNGGTTQTITGIGAGTYTVTVTDANSCTITASTTVSQPGALALNADSTDVTCNGFTDGTATVSISGGTGPFTFLWSNGGTTQTITGLGAGTFDVTVTDGNGCPATASTIVNQPGAILPTFSATNSDCDAANGTATAIPSGGTTPFTYQWDVAARGQTTQTATGLSAGTYSVTLTDANGCTATLSATVNANPDTVAPVVTCPNDTIVNVAPGTCAQTVFYNPPSATDNCSELPDTILGLGSIAFTGYRSDNPDTFSFVLLEPIAPFTSIFFTDNGWFAAGGFRASEGITQWTYTSFAILPAGTEIIIGNGVANIGTAIPVAGGGVNLSASGDQLFAYQGAPPTGTNMSGFLAAIQMNGNWDADATSSNTSAQPPVFTDGVNSLSINPEADQAWYPCPVTFGLADSLAAVINTASNWSTDNANSQIASSNCMFNVTNKDTMSIALIAGQLPGTSFSAGVTTNTFVVTDRNGNTDTCSFTVTVQDNEAPVAVCRDTTLQLPASGTITISGSDINNGSTDNCGVDTLILSQTTFTCANFGTNMVSLIVRDSSGNSDTCMATITIVDTTGATVQAVNLGNDTILCAGSSLTLDAGAGFSTYAWSTGASTQTITVNTSNTYQVTVTNANGCNGSDTIVVNVSTPVVVTADSTNVTCNGFSDGSATATASGGTAGYTFLWSNGGTTATITGLVAGTYTVTVTDANGCTGTASTVVNQPTAISTTPSGTNVSCFGGNDGSATVAVSGGTPGYTFAWSNGGTTASITGLIAGTYTVTVTDANGCTAVDSQVVTQPDSIVITLSATGADCDTANGSISTTVTGGSTPYNFAWSNGATTANLSNLMPGMYSVTVTDANGCIDSASTIVNQNPDVTPPTIMCPASVTVNADSVSCDVMVTYAAPTVTDDCSNFLVPDTSINLGNLLFTGYRADAGDTFSFVLLEPVAMGTNINFTDNGWFAAGGFRANEGTITWTAGMDMPAGAEVWIFELTTNRGSVAGTPGGLNFSTGGDQIFAYQGTAPTGANTSGFIGAIQMNGNWDADATSSNTSAQPPVFTDGVNSLSISPEVDNGVYNCSVTTGDSMALRTAILNTANWNTDNSGSAFSFVPNCGFNVTGLNALTLVQTAGLPSGSMFPVGTTTNTFVATDGAGNQDSCSFTVTVVDITPPVIICPADTSVPADSGACSAVVNYQVPTATDNCGGTTVLRLGDIAFTGYKADNPDSLSWVTFVDIAAGTEINFTDNGWMNTGSFRTTENIMVFTASTDIPAGTEVLMGNFSGWRSNFGTIGGPGSIALNTDGDQVFAYQGALPDSNNLGGFIAAIQMNGAFGWDLTAGNSATSAQPPVFTDGVNSVAVFPEADNAVYNCAVTSGNFATVRAAINNVTNWVRDDNPLVIPIPSCGFSLTGVNAAPGTLPTTQIAGLPSGSAFPVGTTINTYVATDSAGNTDTCSFTVTVLDNQAPVLTGCPANITVGTNSSSCDTVVSWTPPTASDNCGIQSLTSNFSPGATFGLGTTTVTYIAVDSSGNSDSCSFTVTVIDNDPPVITGCPANITVSADTAGCSTSVTWTPPTASDNCALASLTSNFSPGATFNAGTTSVLYIAVDSAGNRDTCSFTITVVDSVSPVITNCPANINADTDPGRCDAIVTWTAPSANDNCGIQSLTSNFAPGDTFPSGVTTVIYTATDSSGNTATCSFTVTVDDKEAPTITGCPASVTVSTLTTSCKGVLNWTPPVASDNCGILSFTSNLRPGDTLGIGSTVVSYIATDSAGNSDTCSFTVTVVDSVPPVIVDCPADITVTTSPGVCDTVVTWGIPTASDNCSLLSLVGTFTPGTNFTAGVTTVQYFATDTAGNVAVCSFTVTVIDNEAPQIFNCPANITVGASPASCDTVVSWTVPTATDNCVLQSLTSNIAPGSTFPVGTTTVTYVALDTAGNSDTCNFTVTVLDNKPPVITGCPANISVGTDSGSCNAVVNWVAPTASDNCSLQSFTSNLSPGATFAPGITTVTYIALDTAGNGDTCSFTVTVTDNEAPVISSCPSDIMISTSTSSCDAIVNWTPPTATDNCFLQSLNSNISPGSLFNLGTTTVTYIALDSVGNADTCSFNVTVIDSVPPVISCAMDTTLSNDSGVCGAVVNYTAPTATDNCSGAPSAAFGLGDIAFTGYRGDAVDTISFVTFKAITPGFQINFTDNGWFAAGGFRSTEGTVTWTAASAIPAGTEIYIWDTSATSGTLTGGSLSLSNSGDQVFAYVGTAPTATNQSNFIAAIQMNGAWDADATSSNTSAKPSVFTDGVNSISIDPEVDNGGYNCSLTTGSVTALRSAINTDTNWVVNNSAGASVIPSCGFTITGSGGGGFGTINLTQIAGLPSGATFPVGSTVNTYVATDSAGNTDTCSFTITVLDTEHPVALSRDTTLFLNASGLAVITPTALDSGSMDNCGIDTLIISQDSFTCSNTGTNMVTFIAVDSSGNADTTMSIVTVVDSTAPTAVCQNISVQLDSMGMATIMPMMVNGGSSDNCSIDSMFISRSSFTCADLGANNVTLTVIDPSGLVDSCTAVVTIVDTLGVTAQNVDLGPDVDICDGSTLNIDAGAGFTTYNWSTGDTTQTIAVTTAGTYSVTVTNAIGCTGSDSIVVNVLPLPQPVLSTTGSVSFCGDDSLVLSTTQPFASYIWSTGDTSSSIVVNATGNYTVTVTGANGCSNASGTTNVTVFPQPTVPVITQIGDTLVSSPANSYQWQLNGSDISGATGQRYVPQATGSYAVIVTDSNGCTNISDTTNITVSSEPAAATSLSIFPNPVFDNVNVDLELGTAQIVTIRVVDMMGHILQVQVTDRPVAHLRKKLDLNGYAQGVYLIMIEAGERSWTKRIKKQ